MSTGHLIGAAHLIGAGTLVGRDDTLGVRDCAFVARLGRRHTGECLLAIHFAASDRA